MKSSIKCNPHVRTSSFVYLSGMGGQLEFFGLWLDAEYGHGRCAPSCTSYQSPQLSKEEHFTYEHLEVRCYVWNAYAQVFLILTLHICLSQMSLGMGRRGRAGGRFRRGGRPLRPGPGPGSAGSHGNDGEDLRQQDRQGRGRAEGEGEAGWGSSEEGGSAISRNFSFPLSIHQQRQAYKKVID